MEQPEEAFYKNIFPNGKAIVRANDTPKFPPKAASALLRVAQDELQNANVVYDPFCGSGTILIMAKLNDDRKKDVFGSDINLGAIEATRLNIMKHTSITQKDVLNKIKRADCSKKLPFVFCEPITIITDPPFGRRCKLEEGVLEKSFNNFYNAGILNISFCFDDKIRLPRELYKYYKIKKIYSNWDRIFYAANIIK